MNNDEMLKTLINELIEVMQDSIQDSSDVLDVLQRIEEQGFTLNVSMVIGIFVRDKDGRDRYFSSMTDDPDAMSLYQNLIENVKSTSPPDEHPLIEKIPSRGSWTEKDQQFLESIGIELDNLED